MTAKAAKYRERERQVASARVNVHLERGAHI